MRPNNKKTYLQLKAKYPDTILLLRSGDYYQAWDNDAEQICKTIGSVTMDRKRTITTCNVQINQRDDVMSKLVKAGYKVAICDPL